MTKIPQKQVAGFCGNAFSEEFFSSLMVTFCDKFIFVAKYVPNKLIVTKLFCHQNVILLAMKNFVALEQLSFVLDFLIWRLTFELEFLDLNK